MHILNRQNKQHMEIREVLIPSIQHAGYFVYDKIRDREQMLLLTTFWVQNVNYNKSSLPPFPGYDMRFAEFPTCVAENSAHAGSVILDCILSLDSGFIDDNSALHVPFCDLSTLLQSNLRVTKMLLLIAEEIHTQMRSSVWDSRFTHVLQRSVGTNFLLNMALLDNHAAKFLRA